MDITTTAIYESLFRQLSVESASRAAESTADLLVAESIRQSLHKEQLALVDDPYRLKSAVCPRRSGKSWAAMSYAHIVCLEKSDAKVVILTLTLKSAKGIYWSEMQRFARHYGLTLEYYINELRVEFPNGSRITLIGAESKAQIDKVRGQAYDLIIIDECKSFPTVVLNELINDALWPALSDRLGSLLLIGTPGSILDGLFYESTFPGLCDDKGVPFSRTYLTPEPFWLKHKQIEPRWSRHTWDQSCNLALPHLWQEALATKRLNGWEDDNPTWLREWRGYWVASASAYVYTFGKVLRENEKLVTWTPQESDCNHFGLSKVPKWHYILGLDLGFEDDTAMVIGAYNEDDPILYQVWEYKEQHRDVDQVGEMIRRCIEMVPGGFDAIVGDFGGGGKQIIETFIRRYGIKIIAAEKRDKYDYIELLNADYRCGRVKLLKGSDLALEKLALQWDVSRRGKEHLARTGKLKEHDEFPNHLCDAWLYLWRYSYHFFAKRSEILPEFGTEEWTKLMTHKAIDGMVKQRTQDRELVERGGEDLTLEYRKFVNGE